LVLGDVVQLRDGGFGGGGCGDRDDAVWWTAMELFLPVRGRDLPPPMGPAQV